MKVRGNRVRIYKVASTHSFKDVDKEAERSTAEAARRIGNLAADDAAKQCHAARHRWGEFYHEDIKMWCDQDQEDLASHAKVIEYLAAFGLHVLGATTETWGKTSPHGAGYCSGEHTTPGHYAPRQTPEDSPAPLGPRRTMKHITAADRPTVRVLFWQFFTTKWVRNAAAPASVLCLVRDGFQGMEWAKPCLAAKGNRNGISWVELATDFMFFHKQWPFR